MRFATVDLVNALEQEKVLNRAGQLADRSFRLDLVILDELGYLPFSSSGGALLFHLAYLGSPAHGAQFDHRWTRASEWAPRPTITRG